MAHLGIPYQVRIRRISCYNKAYNKYQKNQWVPVIPHMYKKVCDSQVRAQITALNLVLKSSNMRQIQKSTFSVKYLQEFHLCSDNLVPRASDSVSAPAALTVLWSRSGRGQSLLWERDWCSEMFNKIFYFFKKYKWSPFFNLKNLLIPLLI